MKGTLVIQRITVDGQIAARIMVRGNVGAEGRAKLDALCMTPVMDMFNCRERVCYTQAEAVALRDALIEQELVEVSHVN